MRVEFYGLTFDLPAGWADITDDLPEGSPPTLAKASGASAVQFSIAKYHSGKNPKVSLDDLRSFMTEFCQNNSIDVEYISIRESHDIMCVGALSETAGELLSAWYLSNGKDVVFTTYVGLDDDADLLDKELDEARAIISSMSFRGPR